MPTTRATISLQSSDLMDNNLSITNTNVLYQAGGKSGVEETTGVAVKKYTATGSQALIDYSADDVSGDAAKLYIKNTSTSTTQYVTILIAAVEIARLYGGDWMFIPYTGGSSADINVNPSSTEAVILEYAALY